MKKLLYILSILFLLAQASHSQYISNINPANFGDPRIIFANPSGIGFRTDAFVVAGYQNLYAGLPGQLNNTAIGGVLLTAFGYFGITGQSFQASLLTRSALDLHYAYYLKKYDTSFGLSLGLLSTAYDRGGFQIIHDDDPLLSGDLSFNALNIGLGLTSRIWRDLILGVSVDHLNKPSISLSGDYQKDMHVRTGLLYEMNNIKPGALWEYEDGEHYFSIGLEYWLDQFKSSDIKVMGRALAAPELFSLGAALQYKNIRLDYLFDYPLNDLNNFAGGTHQFVAAYSFGELKQFTCQPPRAVCVVNKKIFKARIDSPAPVIDPLDPQFPIGATVFQLNGQVYELVNYNAHPFINFMFFGQNQQPNPLSAVHLDRLDNLLQKRPNVRIRLTPCFYANRIEERASALRLNFVRDQFKASDQQVRLSDQSVIIAQKANDPPIAAEQRRVELKLESLSFVQSPDSVCVFDVSHSKVDCGWQSWLLGVYRQRDNGDEELVWHTSGTGQPGPIRWIWTRSLNNVSDFNQTYYCKFRIVDKKSRVAVSQPDQFFIEHEPPSTSQKYLVLFEFDSGNSLLAGPSRDEHCEKTNVSGIDLDCRTMEQLDAIADLQITGAIDIEQVLGYTDTTGTVERNMVLSQQRAAAVHNYLAQRGAHIERDPMGFGESPLYELLPSDTPQGRWMNRRVEILVRPRRPSTEL